MTMAQQQHSLCFFTFDGEDEKPYMCLWLVDKRTEEEKKEERRNQILEEEEEEDERRNQILEELGD